MKKYYLYIVLLTFPVLHSLSAFSVEITKQNVTSIYDAFLASHVVFSGTPQSEVNFSEDLSKKRSGYEVRVDEIFYESDDSRLREGETVFCFVFLSTSSTANISLVNETPSLFFVRRLSDNQLKGYGLSSEFNQVFSFINTEGAILLHNSAVEERWKSIEGEEEFFEEFLEQKTARLRRYGLDDFRELDQCVSLFGQAFKMKNSAKRLDFLRSSVADASENVKKQLALAVESIAAKR